MDQEEIEREKKLGLKQQKITPAPTQKGKELPMDESGYVDFVKMEERVLVTSLPLNTQVIHYH